MSDDEAYSTKVAWTASLECREPELPPYRLDVDIVVCPDGAGCADCGVIIQQFSVMFSRSKPLRPSLGFTLCQTCGEKALAELRAWARTHREAR